LELILSLTKYFKMKKIRLLFVLLLATTFAFAQNNGCDGKRYIQDVFTDTTMTTVTYGGTNVLGLKVDLKMTIVQPKGDVLAKRPVVLLAFGGGFVQGKRQDMLGFCNAFAKKGFVAVTIDYRLYNYLIFGNPDSLKITPTIVQASQDMKASIRYLYKDAKTTNTFRVDTNTIIIGGVSAGAITAMLVAELDATDPIAPWLAKIIKDEGGLEGNSGNPGYSSKVKGVVNMSGALYQKEWIDKDDAPFISYHGTIDKTVAYGYGLNVYNFYGNGSGELHKQALKVGVPSVLVSVAGGDHGDIYDTAGKFAASYANFISKMFTFTKQLACGETIVSASTAADDIDYRQVSVYPNPSNDDMTIALGENAAGGYQVQVFDLTGRVVFQSGKQNDTQYILRKSAIGSGLFVTKVIFNDKKSVLVKKVIFE
jgi:para-nitrobenzyl esterase